MNHFIILLCNLFLEAPEAHQGEVTILQNPLDVEAST